MRAAASSVARRVASRARRGRAARGLSGAATSARGGASSASAVSEESQGRLLEHYAAGLRGILAEADDLAPDSEGGRRFSTRLASSETKPEGGGRLSARVVSDAGEQPEGGRFSTRLATSRRRLSAMIDEVVDKFSDKSARRPCMAVGCVAGDC